MIIKEIYTNVVEGHAENVEEKVNQALEQDEKPEDILRNALIPAMDEVGKRFEEGDFFVPEMLIAARAMKAGLAILKPHLVEVGVEPIARVAIGTVKGDLHDIGKNLVAMMLEGAGFEVVDLGVDVPPEEFVRVAQTGVQVVGLSALLTTTMVSMEKTLEAMIESNVRKNVRVIIGGAPVTQEYADKIGADAYAPDASSAARVVRQLMA